jgi:hypothetical protein
MKEREKELRAARPGRGKPPLGRRRGRRRDRERCEVVGVLLS